MYTGGSVSQALHDLCKGCSRGVRHSPSRRDNAGFSGFIPQAAPLGVGGAGWPVSGLFRARPAFSLIPHPV